MPDIPVIRIGHLKITDHLVLGITADKIRSGVETFTHGFLEPVLMHGWNQVADALADGGLEGALGSLNRLFTGDHDGKLMVRVSEEPAA